MHLSLTDFVISRKDFGACLSYVISDPHMICDVQDSDLTSPEYVRRVL